MRSRRAPLTLLSVASALAVVGWLGWRQAQQPRMAAPITEVVDPAEQALRAGVERSPRDAAARQELGAFLLARSRPYEAIWAFQDALEVNAGDAEARHGVAQALMRARLPRLALTALTGGLGLTNGVSQQGSEERRIAGEAYLAMGDPLAAVAILKSVGEVSGTAPETLLAFGRAAEAIGDEVAAGTAYRRLSQETGTAVEGHLGLARIALRAGRWQEVLAVCREARKAAPGDARPLVLQGQALQLRERSDPDRNGPDLAAAAFRAALEAQPDSGDAHREVGLRYQRQGRQSDAVEHLTQAVAAGAGGAETRLRLAAALTATGQKAAAAYQRGLYAIDTQQPQRAVAEYRRMAALDPDRPDALLYLIAAYAKLEQTGEAAKVAADGLKRFPDDARLLARRAQLLLMTSDHTAGAKLCRDWQSRFPNAAEPYRLLGSVERQALRYPEAARFYAQAIERDPQNAEYHREAAQALLAQPTPERLREAEALLRKAMQLSPGDGAAPALLGDVLQRLGDADGARLQYQHSLDRDPGHRPAAVSLSQLCPKLGKPGRVAFYGALVRAMREREDAARDLWRRAFQHPADADAHARLADLLLEAGDLQQARYQLAQLLALRPGLKPRAGQARVLDRLLD